MKRKEKKIVFHKEKIIGVLIVCAVFLLSIGFSESSIDLGIDSLAAVVRIQKDIRVTGISMTSTSNDAVSNWEDYNYNNVTAGVTLPNADSTVTYEIEITNIGNIESMIDSITGLDSHLEIKNINGYTLQTAVCDDNDSTMCKLGAVKHFTITIGYKDGEYNSNSTDFSIMMNVNFAYLSDKVAKAGDSYYDTLKLAIDSVSSSNPDTTLVVLLKNTTENIQIDTGEKVYLDLKDKTLTCSGNNNAIKNYGTLTIKNGNINCAASTNGAVNNYETGTLTVDGTNIQMTGGRQALWNEKGDVTITGNAYLYSSASDRPTLHNLNPGTMRILSGTIISTNNQAVKNEKKTTNLAAGTLIIGTQDGNINTSNPLIMSTNWASTGTKYIALYSDYDFKFYDGVLKSRQANVNNFSKIQTDGEGSYIKATEIIEGINYNTTTIGVAGELALLKISGVNLTNDWHSGYCTFYEKTIVSGSQVGELPVCEKSGYSFVEFNTIRDGTGTTIDENYTIAGDLTIYPVWQLTNTEVARIGTDPTLYDTLQDAIDQVPTDGTVVDIYLLKDTKEILSIKKDQNIIFHFAGRTITNPYFQPIFRSYGNVTITDGTFISSDNQALYTSEDGIVNISGGTFISTGARQCVYVSKGTFTISGGSFTCNPTTADRAGIQNATNGTLIITGGTITSNSLIAVRNQGTLKIGTDDGTIDATSPVIIGATGAIKSSNAFDFYDGIAKSTGSTVIDGTVNTIAGTQMVDGTETIGGETYYTKYREVTP